MHKMAGMTMVPSLVYALQEFMHYYVMHYEHIDCSLKISMEVIYGLAGIGSSMSRLVGTIKHKKCENAKSAKMQKLL